MFAAEYAPDDVGVHKPRVNVRLPPCVGLCVEPICADGLHHKLAARVSTADKPGLAKRSVAHNSDLVIFLHLPRMNEKGEAGEGG